METRNTTVTRQARTIGADPTTTVPTRLEAAA